MAREDTPLTTPTPIQAGLRAGVAGPVAAGDVPRILMALQRLAALVPAITGRPLLCLIVADEAAHPLAAAADAGWTLHRISGLPQDPAPSLLSLDGSPDAPEAAAAAAAGLVVRNCDVLLLPGDAGLHPAVETAFAFGIPVLSLPPGAPDRLLPDRHWPVSRATLPAGDAAWQLLAQALAPALAAPEAPPEVARLVARLAAPPVDARALPDLVLWRTHGRALSLLWRAPASSAPLQADTMPPQPWTALYAAADALANGYADRYRSSYTLVLGLAAAALIAAVLGLVLRIDPLWTAIPEALCLMAIIVLVQANTRFAWRSRLILFRLLSELCRKQAALAVLGRSLPASRIARMTADGGLGWVGWRFAAAVRAASFPSGSLAGPALDAARDAAAAILLRGQRGYHQARAEGGRRREARLVALGGWAFGLTAGCVLLKLLLLLVLRGAGSESAEVFGLVAALLPALAAALFGFRAYAELDLLVRQSERMIQLLDAADRSLAAIDTSRPLASQHVGDVLEEAAAAMLADIEGWIQISSTKAVEAG